LNPIPVLARSLRRIGRIKMWSSRNQMLTDNDGDDVAFLSGSGATVTTVTLNRDDCDVIIYTVTTVTFFVVTGILF
jgi:hypothetical protein